MTLSNIFTCIWMLAPVFIWNTVLYSKLPVAYQSNIWDRIPGWINKAEGVSRTLTFIIPVFLKIGIEGRVERAGLFIYAAGIIIYFSSWLVQILLPHTRLAKSAIGFTAPAFTAILFLTGIALSGQQNTLSIKHLNYFYLLVVFIFVLFHTLHSGIIYRNFTAHIKDAQRESNTGQINIK